MIEFIPIASGSSGNCYVVLDGGTRLLLECGLTWRKIQEAFDFQTSLLDAVIISHAHLDHARSARDVVRAGLSLFTSQTTLDTLRLSGHRCHAVEAGKQFDIGSFSVMPFETVHEGEKGDTLGFLLATRKGERLLFLTDTCYCPYRFKDLSIIAIECNYSADILAENVAAGDVHPALEKRIRRAHMELSVVKDMLLSNDLSSVQQIWLLHLSNNNSDEVRFKNEIQEVTGKPVYIA